MRTRQTYIDEIGESLRTSNARLPEDEQVALEGSNSITNLIQTYAIILAYYGTIFSAQSAAMIANATNSLAGPDLPPTRYRSAAAVSGISMLAAMYLLDRSPLDKKVGSIINDAIENTFPNNTIDPDTVNNVVTNALNSAEALAILFATLFASLGTVSIFANEMQRIFSGEIQNDPVRNFVEATIICLAMYLAYQDGAIKEAPISASITTTIEALIAGAMIDDLVVHPLMKGISSLIYGIRNMLGGYLSLPAEVVDSNNPDIESGNPSAHPNTSTITRLQDNQTQNPDTTRS